jgi:hypothetical protein
MATCVGTIMSDAGEDDPAHPNGELTAVEFVGPTGLVRPAKWDASEPERRRHRMKFAYTVGMEVRASFGYRPEFTVEDEAVVSKRVYEHLDRIHCRKSHQPMHAPMAIKFVMMPTKWDVEAQQFNATAEFESRMRAGNEDWQSDFLPDNWFAQLFPGLARRIKNAERARAGLVPIKGNGMRPVKK